MTLERGGGGEVIILEGNRLRIKIRTIVYIDKYDQF